MASISDTESPTAKSAESAELAELFEPRLDGSQLHERWSRRLAERFYAASTLYRHRYGDQHAGVLDAFWGLPQSVRQGCLHEPLFRHSLHLLLKAHEQSGEGRAAWRRAMRLLSGLMLGSWLRDGGFQLDGTLRLRADRAGKLTFPNWSGVLHLTRRPPRGWLTATMDGAHVRLADVLGSETDYGLAQAPLSLRLLEETFGVHVTREGWYRGVGRTVIERYRPPEWRAAGVESESRREFPLTPETVTRLRQALSLLQECSPEWAADLRRHGRVIVPIATPYASGFSVTTCRGAVFITAEEDPIDTLDHYVHEASHNKLDTAADLIALAEPMPERRFPSPWREDPRPIEGLIHGVYVFSAVAHVLHDVATRRPHLRQALADRVRTYLDQVAEAVRTVRAEARLTEAGAAFLEGLEAWNLALQ